MGYMYPDMDTALGKLTLTNKIAQTFGCIHFLQQKITFDCGLIPSSMRSYHIWRFLLKQSNAYTTNEGGVLNVKHGASYIESAVN